MKAYVLSGSFYPALIAELDCSPIQAPGLNNKFRSMRLTRMELKKIGKGKENVQKRQEIPYSEIKEAIVTVTFN